MLRSLLAAALMLVVIAPAEAGKVKSQAHEVELEHTFEVARDAEFHFENLLGSITVRPQTRGRTVVIRATARAEAKELTEARSLAEAVAIAEGNEANHDWSIAFPDARLFRMPQSGVKSLYSKWVAPLVKRKTISTRYDGRAVEIGSARGSTAVAVDVELIVPMDLNLTVVQHVGNIDCSSVRGNINLHVKEGVLDAGRVYGSLATTTEGATSRVWGFNGDQLRVESGSGTIELKEITAAALRVDSARGDIEAEGVTTQDTIASTGSGDLKLIRFESQAVEISTNTGAVDVSTEMKKMREASVRSATGNVTLRLGSFAPFQMEANSPSGAVKGSGTNVDVDQREKNAATLARGKGGTTWVVDSESGQIVVRPL